MKLAVLTPLFAAALLCLAGPALAQRAPSGDARKPVKGVDIIVKKIPGQSAHRTATNGEGRFRFVVKEAGRYQIIANDRLMTTVEAKAGAVLSGVITAPGGERGIQNKGVKGCETCVIAMD